MGKFDIVCVHIQFIRDYGDRRFPFDERMSRKLTCMIDEGVFLTDNSNLPADDLPTVLFSRTEHHEEHTFINLFSILAQGSHPTVKNRVVVEHTGNDDGDGEWKCLKDTTALSCVHIVDARHTLQKYLQCNPNATDPNAHHGTLQGIMTFIVISSIC